MTSDTTSNTGSSRSSQAGNPFRTGSDIPAQPAEIIAEAVEADVDSHAADAVQVEDATVVVEDAEIVVNQPAPVHVERSAPSSAVHSVALFAAPAASGAATVEAAPGSDVAVVEYADEVEPEPGFEAQPRTALAPSVENDPASGDAADHSRPKTLPFRMLHALCSACEWCFGVVSLVGMLAVVATIPVLQFMTLGYLLEVSGRIARTGKFTQGFVGVRKAARIGSVVLGTWLLLLPLRFVSEAWYSSSLIDSDSGITIGWRVAQFAATILIVGHVMIAWYCGGRLRHFFWPILAGPFLMLWGTRKVLSLIHPPGQRENMPLVERFWADLAGAQPLDSWFPPAIILSSVASGRTFSQSRDAVWDFLVEMRLPYFFWMGLRGFSVAMIWLFIPMLMVMSSILLTGPAAAFFGIQGFLLFFVVLFFLPFLQTNFAAENRFLAGLDLARGFSLFLRAPLAFWLALTVLLLSALPLYLLKIEATPREVAWLPSIFFVVFCLPARFINGWAVGRALKREKPRFFLSWGVAFMLALPVVGFYILMVYFSQYTSWYGSWSLLEQHAFTLPAPPAIDW